MKTLNVFVFLASIVLLQACSFSAGTNKDLITGLSHSYNGFTVDEVLLVGPDNTVVTSNKVALDSEIAIVAQGIANYELKDGKAFPGLMLTVTSEQGEAIVNEADLFEQTEGYSPEDASALRGTVTVGSPMKSGSTYHMKMHVWDKNKPENVITAEVDLVVL
jgi:hypothetical protein